MSTHNNSEYVVLAFIHDALSDTIERGHHDTDGWNAVLTLDQTGPRASERLVVTDDDDNEYLVIVRKVPS